MVFPVATSNCVANFLHLRFCTQNGYLTRLCGLQPEIPGTNRIGPFERIEDHSRERDTHRHDGNDFRSHLQPQSMEIGRIAPP